MQYIDQFGPAVLLSLLAGASTGIGSILSLFIKEYKKRYIAVLLGFSAGIMIYVSFVELLSYAISHAGFILSNISFFGGMISFMIIESIVPHHYMVEKFCKRESGKKLARCGLVSAVGIAIHNFPEGFTVAVTSLENIRLAIPLTLAIALHNIPEGIVIALPIYQATGSRKKAFITSFASGLTEPVGALVGLIVLLPFLTPHVLSVLLAFVGGIMVIISMDELLPTCFEHHRGRLAIAGIILGMMTMAVSLSLLG